ncbi:hypothetical protein [Pedobacter zeae]|uniref:Uncharacterized protein n=1 Tax=Pedobacter zeae TaxID=1737356 RepID=A0A7W6K7H9_9SPHI|nr:hypothetical protein [Pedobacter zeae]MBB4106648.1 hypothetical protein [Pedobacter zeae]GGH02911.1 hypothetical protein GCM10007422_17640 [Pedobacter zeae]
MKQLYFILVTIGITAILVFFARLILEYFAWLKGTKSLRLPADVHDNKKGFIRTYSGTWVNLRRPTADMIVPVDIPCALYLMPRFGGHTNTTWNVLWHTYLVVALAPKRLKYAALFHDAAEAYTLDIPKPLKIILGRRYARIERRFTQLIARKFNVNPAHFEEVKVWDRKALEMEYAAFMLGNDNTANKIFGLVMQISGVGGDGVSQDKDLADQYYRIAAELNKHNEEPEAWNS